ncbi:MAG: hypothetical protein V2I67_05840 [Thermoanaerobaculales bacterium]|jgi:hypothetical protein|nr:hypothetical protein [Thermoanaerobaculales bacterium]
MRDVGWRHLFTIAVFGCNVIISASSTARSVELVRVVSSVDAATTVKAYPTTDRGIVSFRRHGSNLVVGSQLDGILPARVDVDALSLVDGGGLVFSTSVSFEAAGVAADDEDLVLLDGGALSLVFDGSFYGIPESADIDAVQVESLAPLNVCHSVDAPTKMGSLNLNAVTLDIAFFSNNFKTGDTTMWSSTNP